MSQLSGDLSMVAIISLPTIAYQLVLLVPSCPARGWGTRISCVPRRLLLHRHNRQLLLDLCLLVARYPPKHPWPLSPCVRRYSTEPCYRSTHSLILGMSLCVHLPSFVESHSSCHLLKRVSLAFPRMMSLLQASVLVSACTLPVRPIFLSSQELAT